MITNTDAVRSIYEAFAQGDVARVVGALDGDISWTEAAGFPYGGTYNGPESVVGNVFAKLATEWDGFAAVPHTFVSEGDLVVALGDYSGTYKATGRSFSAPFAHVWTVRNGKAVRFQQHTDTSVVRMAVD